MDLKTLIFKSVMGGVLTTALLLPHAAPAASWRLPDTGQKPYRVNTAGEDGNYAINPQFFTKLDAGGNPLPDSAEAWAMVRDNNTGLIWEVKTREKGRHYYKAYYTWEQANKDFITALNKEKFGNASDWRLPTVVELVSITHKGVYLPAIDLKYFPYTETWDFWSATPDVHDKSKMWRVHFCRGMVTNMPRTNAYIVRAVRGPEPSKEKLVDNNDGTVTDPATGLMWTRTYAPLMTWSRALAHCENMNQSGYTDWRLPNSHELQTLVDYTRYNPAADTHQLDLPALKNHPEKLMASPEDKPELKQFFKHVPDHRLSFWSSSNYASNYENAWVVDFKKGMFLVRDKGTHNYVRAVRGGHLSDPARIAIEQPRQGSQWSIGRAMTISWQPQDQTRKIQIRLSRQGGRSGTFEQVISEDAPDNGLFEWTVSPGPSSNCVLSVTPAANDSSQTGSTVGLFSIVAPTPFQTSERAVR